MFLSYWGGGSWRHEGIEAGGQENLLLKLSCDKALHSLGWHAALSFEDTVRLTAEWYKAYYGYEENMYALSTRHLEYYVGEANKQGLAWAKEGR
jgi:CDP-glucose 4,6-dehydratase